MYFKVNNVEIKHDKRDIVLIPSSDIVSDEIKLEGEQGARPYNIRLNNKTINIKIQISGDNVRSIYGNFCQNMSLNSENVYSFEEYPDIIFLGLCKKIDIEYFCGTLIILNIELNLNSIAYMTTNQAYTTAKDVRAANLPTYIF